jgi:hypothetical protein
LDVQSRFTFTRAHCGCAKNEHNEDKITDLDLDMFTPGKKQNQQEMVFFFSILRTELMQINYARLITEMENMQNRFILYTHNCLGSRYRP